MEDPVVKAQLGAVGVSAWDPAAGANAEALAASAYAQIVARPSLIARAYHAPPKRAPTVVGR
jgi:hypothetical protein